MNRFLWGTILTLLFSPALFSQTAPAGITTLEGKFLRDARADDVRLLGIVARSVVNQAQRKGELPPEYARLAAATTEAYTKQDFNTAYRYVTRLLAVMQGGEVTEGTEVATSFDLKLDRKLVAAGDPLAVTLEPLFTLGHRPSGAYTARLAVKPEGGETVQGLALIQITDFRDYSASVPTKALKPGKYFLDYELTSPSGQSLIMHSRVFFVEPAVKPRVAALKKQLERIRAAGAASGGVPQAAAAETVEYFADLLDRATREYVADLQGLAYPATARFRSAQLTVLEPFDVARDLALAEALAGGLLAGRDPLAERTGDLHLAYRSELDGTLQPFRVFVPKDYTPSKKYPLVIALHGATGSENTYMDRYLLPPTRENLLKKLAQERGYIAATPNGRGPFGGYQSASEKDVLEVTERVLKLYSIDSGQVFLTGHSMGGMGTWLLGFKYPWKFAALAPVAGRPVQMDSIVMDKAPDKPVLYCQGARDTVALPESARALAEAAKKKLARFQYREWPEDDHFVIGVSSMPAIFDFFDAVRKK